MKPLQFPIGTKILVTTNAWFIAPNGQQYRAVFGTVKGIFNDEEVLGVKTNDRSTNWYLEIGDMVIAGCQIHYAVVCDSVTVAEMVDDYTVHAGVMFVYKRPTGIYRAG